MKSVSKPHPVSNLTCPCCGARTKGRQFFNQDAGTGLCQSCVAFCSERTEDMARTYGIQGYHFDLSFHPVAKTLGEAYRMAIYAKSVPMPIEITEVTYFEALGVVPPIYGADGHWWVGEEYTHNSRGEAVSLECWESEGQYFCRLSVVKGGAT